MSSGERKYSPRITWNVRNAVMGDTVRRLGVYTILGKEIGFLDWIETRESQLWLAIDSTPGIPILHNTQNLSE
jgi:hypothetical protein